MLRGQGAGLESTAPRGHLCVNAPATEYLPLHCCDPSDFVRTRLNPNGKSGWTVLDTGYSGSTLSLLATPSSFHFKELLPPWMEPCGEGDWPLVCPGVATKPKRLL